MNLKVMVFVILPVVMLVSAAFLAVPSVEAVRADPAAPVSCATALFDRNVGVVFNTVVGAYVAMGTRGEAFTFDPKDHTATFPDGSKVTLLFDYRGGKPIVVNGYKYTNATGESHSFQIGIPNSNKPTIVCDGGTGW